MKRTNLSRVSPSYPTASATLLIGQDKGKKRPNRAKPFCIFAPSKFSTREVDETVRDLRIGAVARRAESAAAEKKARAAAEKHFAASRIQQKGWFQGRPEASVAYMFHHDPSVPGEKSVETFRLRMKQLAEDVSAVLCQDSVILSFDTPGEKGTRFVDTNAKSDAGKRRREAARGAGEVPAARAMSKVVTPRVEAFLAELDKLSAKHGLHIDGDEDGLAVYDEARVTTAADETVEALKVRLRQALAARHAHRDFSPLRFYDARSMLDMIYYRLGTGHMSYRRKREAALRAEANRRLYEYAITEGRRDFEKMR